MEETTRVPRSNIVNLSTLRWKCIKRGKKRYRTICEIYEEYEYIYTNICLNFIILEDNISIFLLITSLLCFFKGSTMNRNISNHFMNHYHTFMSCLGLSKFLVNRVSPESSLTSLLWQEEKVSWMALHPRPMASTENTQRPLRKLCSPRALTLPLYLSLKTRGNKIETGALPESAVRRGSKHPL